MASRAFVFSLDSFVAFSLILLSIQSMLVISSIPSGYSRSLLQAQYLAKDTLQTLSTLPSNKPQQTLLDFTIEQGLRSSSLHSSDQVITTTNSLIPYPYSYAYHFYHPQTKSWIELYNASKDNPETDIHYNVTYWRVQAPAHMLVVGYSDAPKKGDSPFCNVVCKGYDFRYDKYTPPEYCTQVPCNVTPESTYDPGNLSVGILRLTVWG